MANYELGSLVWRVKGDTANFDKNIGGAQTRFEKFSASARKIGANLTKFVTLPLAGIGIASVKAASDLEESLNAVSVVFGDTAGKIEDFGEVAAEQAGLSQNSFNELATTIGSQLKQSGLDMDAVADQTIELTRRSSDLASVFNVDVKDATNALGAALRGESEPARRFGVNISDAAVQAEALASGLVNSKDEITEQIKVQARYNLIMSQSQQVAGDFENTSDSLANQTKILRTTLENVGAELGQAFIPIVTDAVSALRSAVQWFGDLDDGTKKLIVTLGIIAGSAGPLIGIAGAAIKLKPAIDIMRASFVKLNAVMFANPAIAVAAGITALAVVVGGALIRNSRKAAREQEELAESLNETAEASERLSGAWEESVPLFNRLRLSAFQPLEDVLADITKDSQTWAETVDVLEGSISGLEESIEFAKRRIESGEEGLGPAVERATELLALMRSRVQELNAEFGAGEEQEAYARLLSELNAEWGLAATKAEAFGDSFDLVNEQIGLYENFIEDAIEAGVSLDNQSFQNLIEQYHELVASQEEVTRVERERLDKTKQTIDEIIAEEERLAALRVELFGTEREQFKAQLAEQLALYEEYGLSKLELEKFAQSEIERFNEEQAQKEKEQLDKSIENNEAAAQEFVDLWGTTWDERVKQSEEGYAEFQKLQEEAAAAQIAMTVEALSVIGDQIAQFVTTSLDLRLQALAQEEQAVRDSADAQLAALEERYQRELELAGLAEDTAVEAAEKKLAAAKEANDEEAIAEAEKALEKAKIDEKYAEKRKEIERETAMELWRIEVEQFEAKKKLDQIEAAITTAQMAVNAYNALVGIPVVGPVLAPIAALAAVGFGLKQQQLIASQPSPPMPAFAMGGDFVTNGPQPIMVGDNPGGRERVNIEPLGSEGGGKPMQLMVYLDGRQIANSTVDYINNGVVRVEARV